MNNTTDIVRDYLIYHFNLAKALLDEAIADKNKKLVQVYS